MAPLGEVTNGFRAPALIAERNKWSTGALITNQITPDTFKVKLAENPAGREYSIKINPDGSAIAFTSTPDYVLERAIDKGETAPMMAIGMPSIVNPREVSIVSKLPPEFTISTYSKRPYLKATKMLQGTTADNDQGQPWKMDAYESQEAAQKGEVPTTSVFYDGTLWGQGKPAQGVWEAEAVARVAALFVPVIGTQGNTLVTGDFRAD